MKLIDKDALVAEIEKQRNTYISEPSKYKVLSRILSSIDTLEMKEVDLEKELVDYHNENFSPCNDGTLLSTETGAELTWYDYECIAKHFFELGIQVNNKAQKGEEI